jgi:hypothetical protein
MTQFSAKEITASLLEGKPLRGLPDCMLTNELGEIMRGGDEAEREAAKSGLMELLTHGDRDPAVIAHCYLTEAAEEHADIRELLKKFNENPENREVVEEAAMTLAKA